MQLAIVLHVDYLVNEDFLFSLRKCLGELDESHYLRKWFDQSSNKKKIDAPVDVFFETNSLDFWDFDRAITSADRKVIISSLQWLQEQPPYLDYVLLQTASYLKLGNKVKAQRVLQKFMETSFLEILRQTPRRKLFNRRNYLKVIEKLFELLEKGLASELIYDLFCHYVLDFYNSEELKGIVESLNYRELNSVIKKLALKYYQNKYNHLSYYFRNRYLVGKEYKTFINEVWEQKIYEKYPEIFYFRLPVSSLKKEKLLEYLGSSADRELFYLYLNHEVLLNMYLEREKVGSNSWVKKKKNELESLLENKNYSSIILFELFNMGAVEKDLIMATIKTYEL